MKAIWKGFIAGIILVAIGAGIIIATLALNGWSLQEISYTMSTFTAEHDNGAIEIDAGANTIRTEFYDGDRIEIYYPESKAYTTSVTESDGKIKFETKIKWYAYFFSFAKRPEAVIKLPKGKAFDIKIELGAGAVTLAGGDYGRLDVNVNAGTLNAKGVSCNGLICDINAGTINISALTCPDIKAEVNAGRLSLGVNGTKSDYTIRASVSAGSCNVSNQSGNTDKTLDVKCSAGSVNVQFTIDNSK